MKDLFSQDQLEKLLKDHAEKNDSPNDSDVITGKILSPKCFFISIDNRSIGVKNAQRLFNGIQELVKDINKHLIINLENCSYLSSMAIGQLTQLAIERKKTGLRVAFAAPKDNVLDLIELTGTNNLIEIYSTINEAQNNFDRD